MRAGHGQRGHSSTLLCQLELTLHIVELICQEYGARKLIVCRVVGRGEQAQPDADMNMAGGSVQESDTGDVVCLRRGRESRRDSASGMELVCEDCQVRLSDHTVVFPFVCVCVCLVVAGCCVHDQGLSAPKKRSSTRVPGGGRDSCSRAEYVKPSLPFSFFPSGTRTEQKVP